MPSISSLSRMAALSGDLGMSGYGRTSMAVNLRPVDVSMTWRFDDSRVRASGADRCIHAGPDGDDTGDGCRVLTNFTADRSWATGNDSIDLGAGDDSATVRDTEIGQHG